MGIIFAVVGDFGIDALAIEFGAFQRADNAPGSVLLDIEQRIVCEKVDSANVDALSLDGVVKHIYEISGIETVSLSEIDIDALHSLFGRAAVFLARIALAPFFLAFFFRLFLIDQVDDRSILIILEKPVKFERYKAFQEIFARQPREFARYSGQIFAYLSLVDLSTLDAVGEMIELLFDNMLGRRHLLMLELLADDLFNFAKAPLSREWMIAIDTPVFPARPVLPERWV